MSKAGHGRKLEPHEIALDAAKKFVAYIEFWQSHGTGACMTKYPTDDAFGGYDNIVRRAYELVETVELADSAGITRRATARASSQAA